MLELTAIELSNHMLRIGQSQKAVDVLGSYLNNNPNSIPCKKSLAKITYDLKMWQFAKRLWHEILKDQPRDLESFLKLLHCLIEIDDMEHVDELYDKMFQLVSDLSGEIHKFKTDEIQALIYKQIFSHFQKDNIKKASDLLMLCSLPNSYAFNIIHKREGEDTDKELSDSAIKDRLDRSFYEWEEAGSTVPHMNTYNPTNVSDTEIELKCQKKLLLIMRKYFFYNPKINEQFRRHELPYHLENTAKALGFDVTYSWAEPFMRPDCFSIEEQIVEFDKLLNLIMLNRPDIILFDAFCENEVPGEYLGTIALKNAISALKEKIGFKFVVFYPDAWMESSKKAMEIVKPLVDVFWVNSTPLDDTRFKMLRTYVAPIPYSDNVVEVVPERKDINTAFLGSVQPYNYLRAIWLTLIKKESIPCQLFITNHIAKECHAGSTVDEYFNFMSRIKVTVNFAARQPGVVCITGRSWESIIAKSLLLEEDNREIRRFFAPFVHFIPFKTIHELDSYIRFFEKHEDIRQKIADRAFTWYRKLYSKEKLWYNLISLAFDDVNQ